ncbi:hypothetical protein SAMD00079811_73370 [Scytonema sp. HK-05]|uniref:class I SAM-dependent methyltransferase n=1 Tax=Scytonema sp. HK-05 TaxID=1137095 RepID=UPI000A4F5B0A|nr:class I SAM-dependent methyltransferase [Scytonema sp. HK-05]BAY49708.1 hypothetical protein SAMD00079811_73370 [Scytonema sp. HK-05]
MQTSDFEKVSPTAFMVSSFRGLTDIPYAKELAQQAEAQLSGQSLPQLKEKPVGLAIHLEARYKAINQVMAQYPTTQVLELASGLLPRGLVMSCDPNITFIESDLPEMIAYKQQQVQQLVGERANLHFLQIDATHPSNEFLKSINYLTPGQPVVIVCEGLLMYLTRSEKQQVCANVREILKAYSGVWITSDFISEAGFKQALQNDVGLQAQIQSIQSFTDRVDSENYGFEIPEQALQFACEQGFHVTEYSLTNVVNQLSSTEVLGIDPEIARQMLAGQSVFAMTLDTVDR